MFMGDFVILFFLTYFRRKWFVSHFAYLQHSNPTSLHHFLNCCSPESAQSTTFGVKEGDLILVGTDGLFDNMSEEMLLYNVAQLQVSYCYIYK